MRLAVLLAFCATSAFAQLTQQDILAGSAENWVTYAGDYASIRHSPLDEINTENVSRVVPKWVRNIQGARRLETSPIVYDGVMYATNTNQVIAIDARTGKVIWTYKTSRARFVRY